jgi:hypothetical protein
LIELWGGIDFIVPDKESDVMAAVMKFQIRVNKSVGSVE